MHCRALQQRQSAILISGVTVTTIRKGIEQFGIIARAAQSERLSFGRLSDLTVVPRNRLAVPVAQVARLEYVDEEPILSRRNRDKAITVRTDVVNGVQPPDVTNAILPLLKPIRDSMGPAYRIEIGGAVEEADKGNASLFALFPVMVLAMLSLPIIQLQSFGRLFLVFLSAPLGLIGASLS